MRVLSASEAVAPAWQRTRSLYKPFFSLQTLKLCFFVFLSELVGLCISLPPFLRGQPHMDLSHVHGNALRFFIPFQVFGTVIWFVFLPIGLALFYIGSRLQLVSYEFVLTGTRRIGTMWSRYAGKVWPWLGVRAVLHAIVLSLLLACTLATRHAGRPGQHIFSACAFLIGSMVGITVSLLRDLFFPGMLLQDLPLRTAAKPIGAAFQQSPAAFAGYIVLRVVIGIAIVMMAFIVCGVAAACFFLPMVITIVFVPMMTGGAMIALVLLACLFGLTGFCCFLLLFIYLSGFAEAFRIAFAMFFLGGRYTPLGDLLEPPAAAAPSEAVPLV